MGLLDPRLFVATDLKEGELHPLGPGLAVVYTGRNLDGQKRVNEDSCALLPYDARSGLLVVADGAGGLPAGDKASALTLLALRSQVRRAARRGLDLRGAVLDGIERANFGVRSLGLGAGTTVAVAEINGSKLRPYHVGDSQIMVIGQKGKVKLFTKSHSPVGYALEAGMLEAHEAIHHKERHLVSNLVGQATMHIEVGPVINLKPVDTVLVASDGLFDNLHVEEIVEICRRGRLLAIASTLAELCRQRMNHPREGQPSKPDDLTFIAYRQRVSQE